MSLYPSAPVYTSIYAPDLMPDAYRAWDIRTSWLDRLPGIHRHHQQYLPLYPLAFDRLDLSEYDVVLSNKSGFCHGLRSGPNTVHICYCLTPTRYIWDLDSYLARENFGAPVRVASRPSRRPPRWTTPRRNASITSSRSHRVQARIQRTTIAIRSLSIRQSKQQGVSPLRRADDYFGAVAAGAI